MSRKNNDLCPGSRCHSTVAEPGKGVIYMSDVLVMVYLIVATGLVTVFVFHKATGHRRTFAVLMQWALLGVFVSTVGGLLMLGTFTPNMASYNNTASDMYNVFTWGGIELPEYNDTLLVLSNLGIIINAMGLGILIMTTMAGFLPRTFFSLGSNRKQREAH